MGAKITLDGSEYDAMFGFLLLSLDQRRTVQRDLQREAVKQKVDLPHDLRVHAVAAECWLLGFQPDEILAEVLRRAEAGWVSTIDEHRINVRLVYDRMYEGPYPREVHGFRKPHLEVLERELAAGSTVHEIACAIWRIERRVQRATGTDSSVRGKMPALHLVRDLLPAGVKLSRTVSAMRRYEPVIVHDDFAYAVSDAEMVLPRADVKAYVDEVAAWMGDHWPEALECIDDPRDRAPDYPLDRDNVMLAAEAFARGFVIEEAASFMFDQRVHQDEAYA